MGGNLLSVGQKQLMLVPCILQILKSSSWMGRPVHDTLTRSPDPARNGTPDGKPNKLCDCTQTFTIKRADQILVIENSQIAEMGTHKELIQKGKYYNLYQTIPSGIEHNMTSSIVLRLCSPALALHLNSGFTARNDLRTKEEL